MATMTRWFAPVVLAAGLGVAGLAPAPAQAQSSQDVARMIVDVADVIFRGGQPYYRHGDYGRDDRLVIVRDRWGRPTYYRDAPRRSAYRNGPPYGNAYGYYANGPGSRDVRCKKNGRCEVRYYDPRYDRKRWDRDDDRRDRRHHRRDRDDD
ncbi:hypothetical protein [Lysobacter sp. A3-1-A15]|uniref:hypothetical protein n=1 Tax=Novilysobacter viscosus TaxID=3098602 RepID=UPI002EDB8183